MINILSSNHLIFFLNKSLFSYYKCFIFNEKNDFIKLVVFQVYGLFERVLKTLKSTNIT